MGERASKVAGWDPRLAALSLSLVSATATACGEPPRPAVPHARAGPAIDVIGLLVRPMPRGADQCVLTAPYLVSDRHRAALAELSDADALAWARVPHVTAYARCRYRGLRESTVWRVLLDGELDPETMPMHVRWGDEECRADGCDWPIARWDGEVLELRSPDPEGEGDERRVRATAGAEHELAARAARQRALLEIRVTSRRTSVRTLREDGIAEVVRDESGRHERELSWIELEVLAADLRLRRERALSGGTERYLAADEIDFSDGDLVATQLALRLARMRRRRAGASEPAEAELLALVPQALSARSDDGRVLDLALAAYAYVERVDEALALIDRFAVEADFDPEWQRRVRARGWVLAVRSDHASAGERLAAAGMVGDAVEGDALAPLLAEALAREIAGPLDPIAVEDELMRMAELERERGPMVALAEPIELEPLGVLPALLALIAEDLEAVRVELHASFGLESAPVATIAVLRDGTRLSILPGRAMHAVREVGPLSFLESAADGFRGPGPGPFAISIRLGPSDAPTASIRLEGEVARGVMVLRRVSSSASGWDWDGIGQHLVAPFAALGAVRFPSAELVWRSDDARALARLAEALGAARLAECELERTEVHCRPRSGRERAAVLGGARSMGVLPPD